ncbi:hypothetical protein [Streptomyces sp. NBC_01750]|uniref:hypothetical protein n=1 Tax=Streptomyces sp. NBC_01750 TaxID=2975928 RepID=UPI002DDA59E8|nr:hypothetical protein [Streptomyces sp. NBC_01750]WSD31967.1 hypothetical protein OG966_08575 [Streptomyces sp. NBC_01750]
MRRSMLAAGAVMVVAGLGIGASGAAAAGQALSGGGEGPAYAHGFWQVTAGKGYWFTCPALENTSSAPIEVIDVELIDPPAVWKTGPARAISLTDVGVLGLGAYDETFAQEPGMNKDYSTRPVRIAPGELSPIHYYLRAEPMTAPGAGHAEGCRFTYRSGHRVYVEDLEADFSLDPEDAY